MSQRSIGTTLGTAEAGLLRQGVLGTTLGTAEAGLLRQGVLGTTLGTAEAGLLRQGVLSAVPSEGGAPSLSGDGRLDGSGMVWVRWRRRNRARVKPDMVADDL